jgi:hypothetical protein
MSTIYFDLIKDVFLTNVSEKYTPENIKQLGFMVNRTFSMKFPLQAQALNSIGINYIDVVGVWNRMLYNGKTVPKWIYTKGSKKSKEEAEKKASVSDSTIREYCKYYNLDIVDVKFAINLFGDEIIKEIKSFEKMIKGED